MAFVAQMPAAAPVRVPRAVVWAAVTGNIAIGLGAFWLSFMSLSDLAARAGIAEGQAWVWPLIVDGLIVDATVSVLALESHGRRVTWFPWTLLFAGALVSVTGNGAHAALFGDPTMPVVVRVAISAVPSLVQPTTTHLAVQVIRRSRKPRRSEPPAPAPAPDAMVKDAAEDEEIDARAEAMRLKEFMGWSNRRIARALEVHPSTVGRWLPGPPRSITSGVRPPAMPDPEGDELT